MEVRHGPDRCAWKHLSEQIFGPQSIRIRQQTGEAAAHEMGLGRAFGSTLNMATKFSRRRIGQIRRSGLTLMKDGTRFAFGHGTTGRTAAIKSKENRHLVRSV